MESYIQTPEELPQALATGEALSAATFPDRFFTSLKAPTKKTRAWRPRITASVTIASMTLATTVEIPLPIPLPACEAEAEAEDLVELAVVVETQTPVVLPHATNHSA